jgi:CPA2 family monovalent cation:H+ antiporter-2
MGLAGALLFTVAKVSLFVAIMLVVGRRLIPWILHYTAHTGSRELFRLAVLSIALCIAFGATKLFDVSLALGAFFAGMMLSESPLSQRAAQESLPLRDAFAVLFFVSVGMLFDPWSVIREPLPLIGTLSIILLGKSAAAFLIVRAFGHPRSTALTISASLAQIGEFSFILAELGVALNMLPKEGRDLILAGAILSIMLNPLVFAMVDRLTRRHEKATSSKDGKQVRPPIPRTTMTDHTIIVGYGRVGSIVGATLQQRKQPFLVIETSDNILAELGKGGIEAIMGNAASPDVLNAANPSGARHLAIAIPEAFEAGQIVQQARTANPALQITARAHSDAEVAHLTGLGANVVIMGEREIARGMIEAMDSSRSDGADQDARRFAERPRG